MIWVIIAADVLFVLTCAIIGYALQPPANPPTVQNWIAFGAIVMCIITIATRSGEPALLLLLLALPLSFASITGATRLRARRNAARRTEGPRREMESDGAGMSIQGGTTNPPAGDGD